METYFEDHCATCGTVAEVEATIYDGLGQWVCDSCGTTTIWNTLDVERLAY